MIAIVRKVIQQRRQVMSKQASNLMQQIAVEDVKSASDVILKAVQDCHFSDELQCLRSGVDIAKSSSLWALDCFLDGEGIIRVGGRLRRSTLTEAERHPIILPKQAHISSFVARDCHNQCAHQGADNYNGRS